MSRVSEGTYEIYYDFDSYTKDVGEYINQIFLNSLYFYKNRYHTNNPTGTANLDIDTIEEALGYLEDYLFYFYSFNRENFDSILNNLMSRLNVITVLDPRERGIYGKYMDGEKSLYINPSLSSSSTLTSKERTRLYMCHELGHIQNAVWMDKVATFLNQIEGTNEERQLIYDGFSLLDEATTQDRAETIAYHYCRRNRPSLRRVSSLLFNHSPFYTNFDYYGEFQIPALSFARTLRGIGNINDDREAMRKFDSRSLDEDFSLDILEEYNNDNQMQNFYYLFRRLGIIKNASYAAFGYSDRTYLNQSYNALAEYDRLVYKMRDYRNPTIKRS